MEIRHNRITSFCIRCEINNFVSGEYISAKAPIKVWEKIFNTEFFSFIMTHDDKSIETLIRAEHYSIARDLNNFVSGPMLPIVRAMWVGNVMQYTCQLVHILLLNNKYYFVRVIVSRAILFFDVAAIR